MTQFPFASVISRTLWNEILGACVWRNVCRQETRTHKNAIDGGESAKAGSCANKNGDRNMERLSRRHVTLTSEEMAFLKQLGNREPQSTISDGHRARLMKAGYVREVA